eukprot:symbB.v1.2.032664.t1/scaffold3857.1/size49205/3
MIGAPVAALGSACPAFGGCLQPLRGQAVPFSQVVNGSVPRSLGALGGGTLQLPQGSVVSTPGQTPRSGFFPVSPTASPAQVKTGMQLVPSTQGIRSSIESVSAISTTVNTTPVSQASVEIPPTIKEKRIKVGAPFDLPRASVRAKCPSWSDVPLPKARLGARSRDETGDELKESKKEVASARQKTEVQSGKASSKERKEQSPPSPKGRARSDSPLLSRARTGLSSRKKRGSLNKWASMSTSSLLSSAGHQTPLTRVLEEKEEADDAEGGLSSVLNRMEDSVFSLFRLGSSTSSISVVPPPMTRCCNISRRDSDGGSPHAGVPAAAYAQDLFKDLRQLTLIPRPCDAQHLARLALAGAELTRDGQLNKKQQALLAYRLEMLGWYSREFCEATGHHADSYVDELLPAEWLILLRYFTSCGHVHPIFCEAVSRWLLNEKFGKLQLKQLEEVLNSLGYAGYLTTELGDEICNALKHLPTEAEEQVLVQLASTLAAADAGDSDFYRRVLAAVTAPKTEGPKLGMSEESTEDYWRLSLLFFLAKADVIRWSLLLNILRRLNPRVAESTPYSLIPQLFQHLQSNSLENDVLLLEAPPWDTWQ